MDQSFLILIEMFLIVSGLFTFALCEIRSALRTKKLPTRRGR